MEDIGVQPGENYAVVCREEIVLHLNYLRNILESSQCESVRAKARNDGLKGRGEVLPNDYLSLRSSFDKRNEKI